MLKHDEFVPLAPDGVGVVRVNHESPECSGDSNSLKIERKEDGNIRAYCFRCGESGHYRNPHLHSKPTVQVPDGSTPRTIQQRRAAFKEGELNPSKWSEQAADWFFGVGLSRGEAVNYGLRYSTELGELFLPVVSGDGSRCFMSRRFNGQQPKALAVFDGDVCPYWHSADFASDRELPLPEVRTVVIVEDILSGIKCARYIPSVALMGTHARPCVVSMLAAAYDRYVIFLDDDNAQVKKQQRVLKNTLDMFGETKLITVGKDPKHFSNPELEKLLCEW